MDWTGVAAIITALGAVGGAMVSYRLSARKHDLDVVQSQIAAVHQENERLLKRIEHLEQENEKLRTRVYELEAENSRLRKQMGIPKGQDEW